MVEMAVNENEKKRKKDSGEWCGALNCSNSRRKCPELSFHRFPSNPEKYVSYQLYPCCVFEFGYFWGAIIVLTAIPKVTPIWLSTAVKCMEKMCNIG